ncbi:SGNH/GDSL hydrolase family protein, partial [Singulisphaera rosea]
MPTTRASAGSALLTLPPELFLTGRSSARNWVENLAANRSAELTFGNFVSAGRGQTRNQGFEENWALSGTTAAGYNIARTGTTFAQEYEGFPNEFATTGNQSQPGLITQSTPSSQYTIQDVNVATILIGGNDYAQAAVNYVLKSDTAPLETKGSSGQWVINDAIETSIASAISAIQAASPNTKIVLMTTPNIAATPLMQDLLSAVGAFYPNLEPAINRDAADLDTYLNATYGNLTNVKVVDTQKLIKDFAQDPVIDGVSVNMSAAGQAYTDGFSADGFHPGTILQGVLAQAIVTQINALFPGASPAVAPLSDAEIVNFAVNSQPAVTLTSSAPTAS